MTEQNDTIGGVRVYRFHLPTPGMPDLYHVACERHPEHGFCGPYPDAEQDRADHIAEKH